MKKLSKKAREEILKERFPEFFKMSEEMIQALELVKDRIYEKIELCEEIQSDLEELQSKKIELDNDMP